MPIFRYICKKCSKNFELLLPRWDAEAKCPDCGSAELEKELNRFAAVTSQTGKGCPVKSECPAAGGCGCGGCCGHH